MKRIAAISVVILSLIVIAGIVIQLGVVKNHKTLDEIITAAGKFVRDEHELFISGLDYTVEVPGEKVVLWVNGLPISNNELQTRLSLHKASGTGTQTIEEIEKILVEEKVIQSEAAKLGLTPTDEEINAFISQEKETAKNDPEYKAGVEKIIAAWGLSEDEYWNVYERYNVYRILAADKLSRHLLKDYYSKNKITPADEKQAKEKWDEFIAEKVAKAEVKVNPKFRR
ncbi:MAG: SurA N-terminal domain-containing protein [Bacillota bacterium]